MKHRKTYVKEYSVTLIPTVISREGNKVSVMELRELVYVFTHVHISIKLDGII